MDNEERASAHAVGRWMFVAAWVLGLGLMTILFDDQLERLLNPNQNPQGNVDADGVREVALERNAQGHYIASGRINGRPVEFLLDTGATDVAIPDEVAVQLGLRRGAGAFSQTANGIVPVWRTRLDDVTLGPIRMRDVSATIVPSMSGAESILLGMSFLKRLEMTQRGRILTLRQLPGSVD